MPVSSRVFHFRPSLRYYFRWLVLLVFPLAIQASPLPSELTAALATFRAEGPHGWRFLQKTEAGGESRLEEFDPAKPEFRRWTLIEQNGRAPTPEETKVYNDGKTRRTGGLNAPRIQEQIDRDRAELVSRDELREVWRFPLKSGGRDDRAARFMSVTLTFHRATQTIEQVEIASLEPFSPVLGVKIAETKTVMKYNLPEGERPSLLQEAHLHVRGRAFWFRSLDEDMLITFSDYEWAGKKR